MTDYRRKRALGGRYSWRRLGGKAICPLIVKHFKYLCFNQKCARNLRENPNLLAKRTVAERGVWRAVVVGDLSQPVIVVVCVADGAVRIAARLQRAVLHADKLVTSCVLEYPGEPFSFRNQTDGVNTHLQSSSAQSTRDARILVPGSRRSRADDRPVVCRYHEPRFRQFTPPYEAP